MLCFILLTLFHSHVVILFGFVVCLLILISHTASYKVMCKLTLALYAEF